MEEIEKSVAPLVQLAINSFHQLVASITTAISLPQFIAIGLSFFFALMVHRGVREGLRKLAETVDAPVWDRLFRTARLISLPIAWVIGLWLSLIILGGMGQATGLVRLFASLLNAWVIIRIAATVIRNHTAANAFSWIAWTLAALNAVGQLDVLIRWMAKQRIESSTVNISLWDTVQGLIITGLMLWFALAVAKFTQLRLDRTAALNSSMRVLVVKILRIVLDHCLADWYALDGDRSNCASLLFRCAWDWYWSRLTAHGW